MKRTVFEEMSTSISEKERRDLLKKINRNMNLNDTRIEETIYHVEISKEEKEKYIKEEISRLGFFERLILKIRKFFSGKTEEVAYNDYKFGKLKKIVLRRCPGITNFDTRTVSKLFAENVYVLFLKTSSLVDLFEEFWRKGDAFQKILTQLVESRFPGIVKTINDLLNDDDAEKVIFEKETKSALKEEVIKRFNSYTKKVSDSIFTDIEEEILPLYYFRPIIVFPYFEFFKLFGFNPYSENAAFSFKSAPVFSCIEYIEKIYYALYMVLKVSQPVRINPLLGKYFYKELEEDNIEIADEQSSQDEQEKKEPLSDESVSEDKNSSNNKSDDEKEDESKLKWFYKKLDAIFDESKKINKKIPLVEIIKYYRNDYYYKLAFYIPKLKFKELYFANLKIQILEQINDKYIKARNLMIEKNVDRFFKGKTFTRFLHFRTYTGFDYEKIGVGYFTNIRSMELLFNYLVYYYNEGVRNIIDLSTKTVLSQDKITATTLMMQISTIDDAYVKIQDFDKSLSPDMEDGKLFLRLRYGLANDTAYLKMYKTFIIQKNKVSEDIIQRCLEAFDNIVKTYSELLNSSQFEVKNSLAAHYNVDGKVKTFREFLAETVENIRYFKSLLAQVKKVEIGEVK